MSDEILNRRVLGRYRVLRQLAVGGMGVIYLGRSEGAAGFSKPVVIKRIDPKHLHVDEEAEAYFVNEAMILSQMRHPGVVSVIDFGRDTDGAHLMILEYVHGFTLAEWLRFHRESGVDFPADLAVFIVRRVLEALDYAHRLRGPDDTLHGIVHRDVTPSNVLIDVDGHIKLADFGIARIRTKEETSSNRTIRGKISYLAPEIISGGEASIVSDVYAAALVLHELLVGKNEFRAPGGMAATVHRVVTHVPTRPSTLRDDLPPGIDLVIERALAKNPTHRYPSADALAEDLVVLSHASDKDLERRFQQKVQADFQGELPTFLELESLDVRAAALREAPHGDAPTFDEPSGKRPARAVAAAALAVVVAALGAGGYAYFAAKPPPVASAPRYIVVERDGTRASDAPPERAAPDGIEPVDVAVAAAAATPPATADEARPGAASPSPRPAPTSEERLTRAFASHRRAARACFERHALDLSGSPQVEIQFRIATSGRVESATLRPANLAATALGRCILGVASHVDFGPQERPLRFTIPLTASVSGR